MCGIVGACAQRDVAQILIEGLKRLEYRGYDSAGLAVIQPKEKTIQRVRVLGKVAKLAEQLQQHPLSGHMGIAHTRWATHGQPSEKNAHPQFSHDEIAVVHNGIIENHQQLREKLIKADYKFVSETDTEVIGHLIHFHLQKNDNLLTAINKTREELQGAYALGIISTHEPKTLYALRRGSPLVVGLGIGEHFVASDQLALLPVTQQFIYLEEGDVAKITPNEFTIYDANCKLASRKVHTSTADLDTTSKGKYRHFMLKEIYDQPQSVIDTLSGTIVDDSLIEHAFGRNAAEIFAKIERVQIIACGTSYHAGLVARHWLEGLAGIPTQVEIASEFRYRSTVTEKNALLVALSQSGETADTLAALRKAKKEGYSATLGICNAPQSSLVRESDLVFLMRAGVEIGVAATKTFTSQLVSLLLLTITLGRYHKISSDRAKKLMDDLGHLPSILQQILEVNNTIEELSKRFINKQHALFLGRGEHHAIAMEGALKLKEISYMHAEAYPAGELKHGPLALVDEHMPVIVVAPNNTLIDKVESNIQEVQARGGELFVFADKELGCSNLPSTTLIKMPHIPEILAPIAYTIPLQLLSYHIAVLKGTDVDQPRNLAKSVTVE